MSKNLLGFGRDLEEPRQRIGMVLRKAFIEDIADHGDRPLGAKASFDLVHADEPPEPARFERHAEIPKVQCGIGLAIHGFLIEQGQGRHR